MTIVVVTDVSVTDSHRTPASERGRDTRLESHVRIIRLGKSYFSYFY